MCIRTGEVRTTALQIFVDVEMWKIMEWKYFFWYHVSLVEIQSDLNCMVELGSGNLKVKSLSSPKKL